MTEHWKTVPGYGEKYEVSDTGIVRNRNTLRVLKKRRTYYGAHVVSMVDPELGYTVDVRVHLLVAHAFLPNPDGRCYVKHKDGDRTNNCIDNLAWGNNASSYKRYIKSRPCVRVDSDGTETTFETIRDAAASVYGYASGVSQCCRGKRPHYLGYKWRYADGDKQQSQGQTL